MIERDRHGLYSQSWQGEIVDEAFSHPAKFSRGLIKRIYEHALEQGWIKVGDIILDPFGGVALGGLDAMKHGLHWVGVELEQKFVELGNQNITLWENLAHQAERWGLDGWGTATLIQGDSRQLMNILSQVGGVVNSPPYIKTRPEANSKSIDIEKQWKTYRKQGGGMSLEGFTKLQEKHSQGYGSGSDNLANLKEGDINAVLGSPPYIESVNQSDGANDARKRIKRKAKAGIDTNKSENIGGPNSVLNRPQNYGSSDGQMGAMKEGNINAVLGSPPYGDALNNSSEEIEITGQGGPIHPRRYGSTDGQLGKMRVVSSPPYGDQFTQTGGGLYANKEFMDGKHIHKMQYGSTDGNLGNSQSDDFWTAAKIIMEQCYSVLEAGSVAIWVLKGFVRNKKYVDFPDQWRRLGESVGFTTIEWIRAWLIEPQGKQYNIFGELEEKTIERKSFFRRLAESKGSPRIDYEVVLIQQKL